ncbi:MAG: hypothetical protein M3R38_27385 [Actinomycetota bacterium]|nr:hypothetical protein [Actinomycetota bacterium]
MELLDRTKVEQLVGHELYRRPLTGVTQERALPASRPAAISLLRRAFRQDHDIEHEEESRQRARVFAVGAAPALLRARRGSNRSRRRRAVAR